MVTGTLDYRPRTHRAIRSEQEVKLAASAFAQFQRPFNAEHGNGGRVAYLSVGPGRIKLGTRSIDTFEQLHGLSRSDWLSENSRMEDEGADIREDDDAPRRGKITGWSQKSRNRMRDTLGCLDYSPLFRQGQQLPKMLTLTMPHRWEGIAPTADIFKRKLIDRTLKQSFRRHWGYDLVGVWKMEFQDRKTCRAEGCHDPKAPHLHILVSPPSGLCPQTGETFETWLRNIWAKACRDSDSTFEEIQDHRAKGVHIADTYGLTGTDSKRIADYFVKHGTFSAKEYQNIHPALWGDSPGRFWGYWGLKKADGEQILGQTDTPPSSWGGGGRAGGSPDAGHYVKYAEDEGELTADGLPVEVAMARILRRWSKANGKHRKVRVTVPDHRAINALGRDNTVTVGGKVYNAATGEVLERRLSVWKGPFVRSHSAGFVSVNDGVGFAEQLHAAVAGVPLRGGGSPVAAQKTALDELAARRARLEAYYEAIGKKRAA